MAIAIQPFEPGHCGAVADFNRRLAAAGSRWSFPEHPEPSWLARAAGSAVFQEFFVAAPRSAGGPGAGRSARPERRSLDG